ncbi:MAG TPA: S8 family serine peptidase, partial [Vicinamibacterales bacterium]|nr:S8 family serine peptidase [Vicinamibacterales bacterium]
MSNRASRVGAALALAAGLCSVTAQGQLSHEYATRAVVQDVGLPAIDRGLRDQDPPRPARTARTNIQGLTTDAADSPYLSGSVIVKFKDDATRGAISAATAQVAGEVMSRSSWANFDIVDIPDHMDPEAAAAALRSRPDVEYAQPRYLNHAMARPNDTLYGNQWNFPAIDMERAWDIQPGASSDIVVAVLDSGMAFRSITLRYQRNSPFRPEPTAPVFPPLGTVTVPFAAAPELGESGSSRFVAPRDFIWNDDTPVDLDGHGTHVAGTIGQLTNNGRGTAGMAYNVRLMPVKVIAGFWDDYFNSPIEGSDDVVARGIRYAADNGADIINLSIGRETGGPATVVIDAVRYAVQRGCFVVTASGNTRAEGNASNRLAEPAREIDGFVAVGAVGRTLDLAFYSTTGPFLELAAPGGDQRQGGTSAGILQQTLDLDLVETYLRPVS